MSNYQHILVPTDFSKPSEVAAGRAVELAKFYKARLSVIHVVDYVPPSYVAVELLADLASASKLSERAEKKLAERTQRLGLAPRINGSKLDLPSTRSCGWRRKMPWI